MDATYINPALNSIVNVLTKMACVHPERQKAQIKTSEVALGDMSSLINMEGSGGKGSVAISFSRPVIEAVAKLMLPPGLPFSDDILKDLTGELSNMIAGGMKAELEDHGLKFDISLPQISFGEAHKLLHNSSSPVILLPFSTELGSFYVELSFTESDTMDAAYLNPALTAIVNIMEKMAQLHPVREAVRLKPNAVAYGDISSLIEMKGSGGHGSVAVSFTVPVIQVLGKRMLPPNTRMTDKLMKDLTGEIANMIAGGMKSELEAAGLKFDISLPKILSGRPHRLDHSTSVPAMLVPFKTDVGPFYVELSFSSQSIKSTPKPFIKTAWKQ